jgi:polysaccharide export outer membrane protein
MKTSAVYSLKVVLRILVVVLLFSSCVSQKKVQLLQEKSVQDISSGFVNNRNTVYHLQPGDQLYINVHSVDQKTNRIFQTDFPNPMTSTYQDLNSYRVDEEGYINFSFIDKVQVEGLTVKEVNDRLQATVNEYFKEATVVVKLVNYRVSVLGEVENPGTFIVKNKQINILQAIAQSGGITNFSNIQKVKLVRQTLTGSEMHYLDLTDNGILQSDYFYLLPNDVLYVEPLNSKSFAFENFPYSLILSTISTAAIIITLLQ